MILSGIADRLQAQGVGLIGKTIFEYAMPAACGEGILLLDNYYGVPVNNYLPGYYTTDFRLIAHSHDMAKLQALAAAGKRALTVQGAEVDYGAYRVKQCLATNLPRIYKRSDGGYWEAEVDFYIAFAVL